MYNEDALLASCYHESLCLVKEYDLKSVAIPSISTGAYGFPKERAAGIAIKEVLSFTHENEADVWLVCFDDETYELYKQLLTQFQMKTGVEFIC